MHKTRASTSQRRIFT